MVKNNGWEPVLQGEHQEFNLVYDCTYFLELVGRTLLRRNLRLFFF